MLFSSLLLYKLFFKEIKFGCNKKPIAPVLEARNATENKFLPEVKFSAWSLLISACVTLLFFVFLWWMFKGFETNTFWSALKVVPWYFLLGGILVVLWLLYLSVWQNGFADLWVEQHKEEYFVQIGKDGVVRATHRFWVFIPWEIIDGADFQSGVEFDQAMDYTNSFRNLKINLKGHTIFTPNFIKGHGGGNIFDDWVEYSDEDMQAIERLVNQRVRIM